MEENNAPYRESEAQRTFSVHRCRTPICPPDSSSTREFLTRVDDSHVKVLVLKLLDWMRSWTGGFHRCQRLSPPNQNPGRIQRMSAVRNALRQSRDAALPPLHFRIRRALAMGAADMAVRCGRRPETRPHPKRVQGADGERQTAFVHSA